MFHYSNGIKYSTAFIKVSSGELITITQGYVNLFVSVIATDLLDSCDIYYCNYITVM